MSFKYSQYKEKFSFTNEEWNDLLQCQDKNIAFFHVLGEKMCQEFFKNNFEGLEFEDLDHFSYLLSNTPMDINIFNGIVTFNFNSKNTELEISLHSDDPFDDFENRIVAKVFLSNPIADNLFLIKDFKNKLAQIIEKYHLDN